MYLSELHLSIFENISNTNLVSAFKDIVFKYI